VDIYRYMNNYEHHRVLVPNGGLYVITGCDKAKTYKLAFFPDHPWNAGKPTFLSYKDGDWDENDGFAANSNDERPHIAQASVFLRGIRVALSERLWAAHLPMVPQDEMPWSTILTTPVLGFRSRIIAKLYWQRSPNSGIQVSDISLSCAKLLIIFQLNFHPSSILLELLLLAVIFEIEISFSALLSTNIYIQTPSAEMAMVEDTVWQSVADGVRFIRQTVTR